MDEPTAPAPRCSEHDGAHSTYLGRCYAFGKAAVRPYVVSGRDWPCANCGQRVYARFATATGERTMLDIATGSDHACPPPLRVEIDEVRLADGMARAFDRLRDQRRQERTATAPPTQSPTNEPPPYPSGERHPERTPLGGIPRLTP